MPPTGRKENLAPPFESGERARQMGAIGGKKSGEAKRKKKLLSEIYAEILAEEYGVKGGSGLKEVVKGIIARKDSPSVSMLKEIREATEGSKIEHTGTLLSDFIKNLRQE